MAPVGARFFLSNLKVLQAKFYRNFRSAFAYGECAVLIKLTAVCAGGRKLVRVFSAPDKSKRFAGVTEWLIQLGSTLLNARGATLERSFLLWRKVLEKRTTVFLR